MSEMVQDTDVATSVIRVVSSEISGNFPQEISGNFRKFIPIFPEISGNFLASIFFLCQSAISKYSDAVKNMFLTNNSPDLSALTLCIMFRKNNLFL